MQTTTSSHFASLRFDHLAAFAAYLLKHQLQEFGSHQLALSRTYNVPALKWFTALSEEQMTELVVSSASELLSFLAHNNAYQQIQNEAARWTENQLPQIDRHQVTAEDITLVNYVRKQTFLHFIPDYSTDATEVIKLVKEIDLFSVASETELTNIYTRLLKDRIAEHAHLIQKINNTSPGIIYVFNLLTNTLQFINQRGEDFFGYTLEQLTQMGPAVITNLLHPDDVAATTEQLANVRKRLHKEIETAEFRLKNSSGSYYWMRNHFSVFKRNEVGEPVEIIGIVQDIDKEKKAQLQLQQQEHQLLEAQEIAQVGSFTWDIEQKLLQGSPKLYQILEIAPGDFETFLKNIHPQDKSRLQEVFERALQIGIFDFEYRYQVNEQEKIIWSKGLVNYKDGQPNCLTGTIMDVTERYRMLEELRHSDERYKQAEAITKLGSYEWNVKTNEVIWSDELYRIHGLNPQGEKIKQEKVKSLRHPDDLATEEAAIQKALQTKSPLDYYTRINLADGVLKILHVRGEVLTDTENNPIKIIGTCQDVTEKQNLIRKLRRTEHLYKQAEALANMGNYTMDLTTNKIEWTDQLYIIYGLQPQSEEITLDRFYSFIHPDDRAQVDEAIHLFYQHNETDYTFRIKTSDGLIKTLRSIAQVQKDESGKPAFVFGTEQDITEQRHLIDQLQQSEKLYKDAQAIARLGNWRFNVKTKETTWSEGMYRIYEVEPTDKISFELFISFIHPEEKEEVLAYLDNCIKNKTPYNKRHRIVLRNGKIKTLHRKGELKLDAGGEVVELYGTTQDITEQQAVENELKEKQNFIQKIADASPAIIASYNVNTGKFVFINKGITKLLGYLPAEVMEKGTAFFAEVIHPNDSTAIHEKNTKLQEEFNKPENRDNLNMIADFRYRMRHKNGYYRWFQTYGTIFDRNSQGLIEHILNISLDITDQIEATQKIEEQEYFINQIADASPTVLYLFDVPTNSIIYINREIYYVLGYTIEEVLQWGANVTQMLYHPDDIYLLPERKESTKKFQHLDSMMQFECRMKSKNEEWCWVLAREVIFKKDEQGNVLQILGSALDISKRKEMEKTLLQNSFQLEQSNASLEEFAYVASHDLKEPLRKISTFGDRLINTQLDRMTDDGKVYLKKIIDASQRMQTMVTDLLSISLISGDRAFEPYSLQTILDEVLQTLEYKIEQKNAIIQADPLPEANIVPSQFRQLFQNLLSNSLKFVREGVQPVITINYGRVKPEEVKHLQLKDADYYHRLDFRDNGIGFEEEYAGKIFAIFQRLHGRSEYEGTGIGLAICKKIVEHHGGCIYATGTPDIGATFTIILPA